MNSRKIFSDVMLVTVAIVLMFATPVVGAQTADSVNASPSETDAQARAVLSRMAEFLSAAGRLSVTVDIGFDAVQESGEKIEFGETRQILVRRPDRIRVNETKRNGDTRQIFFDGNKISVFLPEEKVYASIEKPGTIDEAINYFIHDLGMRLPLSELLSSNVMTHLSAKVRSAAYVEKSFISGVACDHVIFYGDNADMQLWVARGSQPLPQKVVITYRYSDGQPQFRAQFADWSLAPKTSDSLFVFAPPADVRKIAFSPRQQAQVTSSVAVKGGQP